MQDKRQPGTHEVNPLRAIDHLDVLNRDVRSLEERQKIGRTIESCFALKLRNRSVKAYSMHSRNRVYSQLIVPRLSRAVEGTSSIEDDVLAAKEPKRGLVLEVESEGVVGPIVEIRVELDGALEVLTLIVSRLERQCCNRTRRGLQCACP